MIDYLVGMNRHLRITLLLAGFIFSIATMPFVGGFWLLSIIIGFSFLTLLIYSNMKYGKEYSIEMENSLETSLRYFEFQSDDSYLSDDFLSGIAINEAKSQIAILERKNVNDKFTLTTFNFHDIVECSVSEDGETLTKVSKGSVIGSSIIGSAIAGSAGMIVGGIAANKHSKEQIVKATLYIVVDDISNPIRNVHFLNSKMLIDKNSDMYQSIHEEMNKWYKRLSVIIRRNEKLNTKTI